MIEAALLLVRLTQLKWGLIGFMKTLSMELGIHNIRANAILPGAVDGEQIQKVFQGRADAQAHRSRR
jgi:NAD(P)-dependent dehydrogenase (short-subunit alcohol dehydrogenase family)